MKKYFVHPVTSLTVTGSGDDPAWDSAIALTDFSYPWNPGTPSATEFKALWSPQYLFFLFRVSDPDILDRMANIRQNNRPPVESDRVEIFFKADDTMNPYYSLEMDALGRILDTKGFFYRKIDFDWTWPAGHLTVRANAGLEGYTVEGAISLESLHQLGMWDGSPILKAGLFRGQYDPANGKEVEAKWISWVRPDSAHPDFHIPSAFGELVLVSPMR